MSNVSDDFASTAAMSAGDLSALGQDADRVGTVESLPVPSGGGGIGGDICLLIFKWAGVSVGRASKGRAQVATVRVHETEPAGAECEDVELSGVLGHVVAFAQQQKVAEVGAAAVYPVDPVVGVQGVGVRTARVGAMAVLTQQEGAVLAVGDEAV